MAQTIKLKRSGTSGATPTTSQLELGEVAINTYDGKMYIKKNVGGTESIVEIGSGGGSGLASSFTLYEYTATSGQTTFSGSDGNSNTLAYDTGTPPKILVYLNGVLLDHTTDYTATNGTSVVLTNGAATNDLLQIAAYESSVSTTLDIDLSDNQKLLLGDDDDLQIYHDGSISWIQDSAADLRVETNNLTLRSITQENYITAAANGAVTAYYDGSAKLATTNDGVTVTGDVEADEFIGDVRGAVLFKAQAGESLAKGEVVYISGISGNTTIVSKADADDASKMPAFGLVAAAASSGNPVDIYTNGILSEIDTSAYSEGDELFVSTTAGALTATPPTGESAALQKIGKVTRSNATSGSIFIIGAGRSNAVPNLDDGDIFIGNASNQAVTESLTTAAQNAGALMDSEVTNLAQVKAFDSSDYATAAQGTTADSAMQDLVDDTTPQLGGNLDLNSNNITGTGNISNTGTITSTSNISGSNLNVTSTNWLGWGDYGERISGSNANSSLTFSTDATTALTLDSSQNATFAGTISSGAIIASSGADQILTLDQFTAGWNYIGFSANGTRKFYVGNGAGTEFVIGSDDSGVVLDISNFGSVDFNSANITAAGTISSGAITSTGSSSIGSQTLYVSTDNYVGINTSSHVGTVLNVFDVDDEDVTLRLHTNTNSHQPVLRMNAKNSAGNPQYADIKYNPDSPSLNFHVPYNESTPTLKIFDGGVTIDGTISSGNITTSGYLAGPATFTIDPAAVGDNTGTVVIAGNLQVDGTTTTINSTTLTVDDKNITLASGSTNAAAANGAGLTVDCGSDTDATFTYDGTNDEWDFNKNVKVSGSLGVTNIVTNKVVKFNGTILDDSSITDTGSAITLGNNTTVSGTISSGLITSSGGSSGRYTGLEVVNTTNAAGTETAIGLGVVSAGNTACDVKLVANRVAANSGSDFYIEQTDSSGVQQERFRITEDGNVGIGTDSPEYILDIGSENADNPTDFIRLNPTNGNGAGTSNTLGTGLVWKPHYTSYTKRSAGIVQVGEGNYFRSGLAFYTNNTADTTTDWSERMRIDMDGNVGIGTDSPDEFGIGGSFKILSVGGDRTGVINIIDDGVNGSYLQFGTAAGLRRASVHAENGSDLVFTLNTNNTGTGLTERFRIKSSTGNVGIGISDPDQKLDVNGNIRIPNAGKIVFGSAGASPGDYLELNDVGSSGSLLKLVQDSTTKLVVQGVTGRVGIGTDSPNEMLQINSSDSAIRVNTSNAANNSELQLLYNNSSNGMIFRYHGNSALAYIDNTYPRTQGQSYGDILFRQSYAGTMTEHMRLTAYDGFLGIGTNTPKAKLQVEVAGIDTTTTSTSATTQVAIDTFAAATFRSARYTIQVTNSTDSTYHITEILLIHDGTTPQITEYGTIFTGSAEATFDADISSGNVRLLATPATTDSMTFKVVRHCITV